MGQWLFRGKGKARSDLNGPSIASPAASSILQRLDLRCLLVENNSDVRAWHVGQVAQGELSGVLLVGSDIAGLARHASLLTSGACLPIGSRAFMSACMAHAGLEGREWSCYPKRMREHMLHRPRKVAARFALSRKSSVFVKPAENNTFRGFVLRREVDAMQLFAREQLEILLDLAPSAPVWMAEALPIASEWRYYIHHGQIVGFCPAHPPGSFRAKPPEQEVVSEVLAKSSEEYLMRN